MGTQLPSPKRGPPIFGPYLLRPNGCMDQDATWYGGRPRPRRQCVRWGPSSPFESREPLPQIFGPCLLWPKGWVDHDGTWHGGRPQPKRLCVRWGPSPLPKRRRSPWSQFLPHVYCGQMAGWIKMALGKEVDLLPGHIVLDGDRAPLPKRGQRPPIFGPFLFWPNGWMHQDTTWYGGRPQPRRLCVRWGPSPLPKKRRSPPNIRLMFIVANGWMDQDGTWHGSRPRPRRLCVRWGPSYPQKKRHTHPHLIFGSRLLWLNGWMDQDATWYGGKPRPRRRCVRWGRSSPP